MVVDGVCQNLSIPSCEFVIVLQSIKVNSQYRVFNDNALDYWHSAEYQATLKKRVPYSTMDLLIIEGYEGIQLC